MTRYTHYELTKEARWCAEQEGGKLLDWDIFIGDDGRISLGVYYFPIKSVGLGYVQEGQWNIVQFTNCAI